ncbi:MAG: tetratricopeptide repeat protein [Chrysiogenales bacterium]|nr:MAG: tetratricopeptide repeat protein [Chrysiogenales bacterium]
MRKNYGRSERRVMRHGTAIKSGIRIVIVFAIALVPATLKPADAPPPGKGTPRLSGDLIIGARTGYSMFAGPYGNTFRGSYCVGTSLSYGNQGIVKFLAGEIDFSYARHPMRESKRSYLQSFSASIGPVFHYPVARFFQPYAGISARGSYIHLHAENTRKNVKSFKPGLLARAGFYIPIARGFRLRAGADYSLEYLSGKPLHGLQFIGGVAYNFNADLSREGGTVEDSGLRADRFAAKGAKALAEGRVEVAKEYYRRALELDPKHSKAGDGLRAIVKAEADFARAMKLSEGKRYYEALAILEGTEGIIPQSVTELKRIRGFLAGEIPVLERKGIDLYETGDYRGCIATMRRLLVLDPDNKTGSIYLPRAQKRQEALERLR